MQVYVYTANICFAGVCFVSLGKYCMWVGSSLTEILVNKGFIKAMKKFILLIPN